MNTALAYAIERLLVESACDSRYFNTWLENYHYDVELGHDVLPTPPPALLDLEFKRPVVYVIQSGESGPLKIGCTVELLVRIRRIEQEIQVYGWDKKYTIVPPLLVRAVVYDAYESLEQSLHLAMQKYWLVGEWFRWTPETNALMHLLRWFTPTLDSSFEAYRQKHITFGWEQLAQVVLYHLRSEHSEEFETLFSTAKDYVEKDNETE